MARWLAALCLTLPASLWAWTGSAGELAGQMREAGLDRDECYHVRELTYVKEDVRFYLTDGYLIFGKSVDGHRHAAVFAAETDAGDAEVLLFPPTRSERMSLAHATGSPNLNEHFKFAVLLFSDDTYEVLSREIGNAGEPRKSPEMGVLLDEEWSPVVRNITSSFETRLVADALSGAEPSRRFLFTTVTGDKLGNFDILYDGLRSEQIAIGRVSLRDNNSYFDIWTSFESRSYRNKSRTVPGDEFHLSNYRLDATLEPDLSLKVTTRVALTPVQNGRRVFVFELSPRMRLSSAWINGAAAECFQREALRESLLRGGDSVFLLIAPAPLERGKSYEVEFHHEGKVIQSAGNNVYYVGARENWYPNLITEFATYDVFFRYPKNLNLVVAGDLVDQGTQGDYGYTHRRISTPVRFLGFNLGEYEHASVAKGPYKVDVYANQQVEPGLRPPPSPAIAPRLVVDPVTRRPSVVQTPVMLSTPAPDPLARLRQLASEIGAAFEFMAGKFGQPPLRNLTVAPIPGSFGQGFPGLVYLSTISYLPADQRPVSASNEYLRTFFSDILHAHEVAHQWWGNAVSTARPQDAWLMEALANYSALLLLEKNKGPKALESALAEYRKRLLAETSEGHSRESMGPIIWGARLLSSEAPDAWQAIVYEKGSWIIHMLRRRLGDDRFFSLLGEAARRYSRSTLTTDQFRAMAAKYMAPGSPDATLETFFDNWVYATGIPTLHLDYSTKGKAAPFTITGKVTQSGVDPDFTTWVPVEVQFRTGKPAVQWVKTDSEPVSFSVVLKQAPLKVALDPSESTLAVRK